MTWGLRPAAILGPVSSTVDAATGLYRWSPRLLPDPPRSVAAVLEPALSDHPGRLALVDGDRRWTYAELDSEVHVMARRLAAAGLVPGARLLWSSVNCAELVIAFLATQRLGAVWAAVTPRLPPPDRARLIERLDPAVTVLEPDDGVPEPDGETTSRTATADAIEDVDPLAPAAMGLTSGSTGEPKIVVHSQHGLLVPAHVSRAVEPPGRVERIGTPLSLTSLNLLVLGPLSAFVRGSTAVVMHRTDSAGFAAEVEEHEVTRALVVPTMLHDLVLDDSTEPAALTSLDRVIAGAAAGRSGVFAAFWERFGVRPTASYGLTEAPTGVVRESQDDPIGSGRGFPLPHVSVSIDDGEIVVAPTPTGAWAGVWTPMLGYWGDPEATANAVSGGALRTGDRGELDADGGVRVAGRVGDVINRGGELISPAAVRAALVDRPEIVEAAVAGYPDDRLGEAIGAVIVLASGATLPDLDEVLPRRHVPTTVLLCEDLPRLPSGKADIAEVRRLLAG